MDFTSAMETYAEAWVAANTQTAVTDQVRHRVECAVEIEDDWVSCAQGLREWAKVKK